MMLVMIIIQSVTRTSGVTARHAQRKRGPMRKSENAQCFTKNVLNSAVNSLNRDSVRNGIFQKVTAPSPWRGLEFRTERNVFWNSGLFCTCIYI